MLTTEEWYSSAMNRVRLGKTNFVVSQLGFGCAQLMGRVAPKQSRRALDRAFDLGVNYFDTARSYGYGESEAVLGEFLRGKRDKVVLATKFGIDPPQMTPMRQAAKALLRPVFRKAPFIRRVAKRQLGGLFERGTYTRKHLLASVERSLGKLRTDYVDILLIHDAGPEIWETDETFDALLQLVRQGKVRFFGVAADTATFSAWRGPERRSIDIAQFPFSLFDQRAQQVIFETARADHLGTVAYQPFGGGGTNLPLLRQKLADLIATRAATTELRKKLENPDVEVLADVCISAVIRAGTVHVVLCSMVEERYIQANVNAAASTRFTLEELHSIRRFFANVPHQDGTLAKANGSR